MSGTRGEILQRFLARVHARARKARQIRAGVLKPNVTRMGLASASRDGTTYWTLILAAPPEPPQSNVRVLSVFPPIILFRVGTP